MSWPSKATSRPSTQGKVDFFDRHLEDDFARTKVRRYETKEKAHGRGGTPLVSSLSIAGRPARPVTVAEAGCHWNDDQQYSTRRQGLQ